MALQPYLRLLPHHQSAIVQPRYSQQTSLRERQHVHYHLHILSRIVTVQFHLSRRVERKMVTNPARQLHSMRQEIISKAAKHLKIPPWKETLDHYPHPPIMEGAETSRVVRKIKL